MSYLTLSQNAPFTFDPARNQKKGKELHEEYNAATPFPNITIDNFLPESVLHYCLENFPQKIDADGKEFNRAQERFKASFNPDYLPHELQSLFYAFNSRPFINFLENLTGIKGLIPDPYFLGAGFHEIGQGGHLSMHADFNHHKPMNLERRINILIYLNEDWKDEYGGQLELWDLPMENCIKSIVPIFNRAAIFNTTSTSWHGNPQAVNHPNDINRRSIALYYYTSTWDGSAQDKTTQFKVRPGTDDMTDWTVKRTEFINEFFPPFMARKMNALSRKIWKK